MGTYIIHFDDKPWEDLDDELYYRCFEIPWFSTTKTTISRLTPYTEDSAYAHGYTEAESKYREIRDELEKQAYKKGYETAKHEYEDCTKPLDNGKAYQQGLTDAWEAARKICLNDSDGGLTVTEIANIFDVSHYRDAMKKYSASEAIEKIRQYEQEKEEQIQVGDEVKSIERGWTAVVTRISDDNNLTLIDSSGAIAGNYKITMFVKTGRHFPEIVEVLQNMKETDNG